MIFYQYIHVSTEVLIKQESMQSKANQNHYRSSLLGLAINTHTVNGDADTYGGFTHNIIIVICNLCRPTFSVLYDGSIKAQNLTKLLLMTGIVLKNFYSFLQMTVFG